jgi:hypothetical protein
MRIYAGQHRFYCGIAKNLHAGRVRCSAGFGGFPPDEEIAARYFGRGGAGSGSGGRLSRNGRASHTFAV